MKDQSASVLPLSWLLRTPGNYFTRLCTFQPPCAAPARAMVSRLLRTVVAEGAAGVIAEGLFGIFALSLTSRRVARRYSPRGGGDEAWSVIYLDRFRLIRDRLRGLEEMLSGCRDGNSTVLDGIVVNFRGL